MVCSLSLIIVCHFLLRTDYVQLELSPSSSVLLSHNRFLLLLCYHASHHGALPTALWLEAGQLAGQMESHHINYRRFLSHSRVGKFHYCYSPLSKPYVRFSTHTAWAPLSAHNLSSLIAPRGVPRGKVFVNPVYYLLSPFFTYCRDLHCTCKSLSVILVFSPSIARYYFVSTTEPIGSVQNPGWVISVNSVIGDLFQSRDRWSVLRWREFLEIRALITKSAGFHLRLCLFSISAPALVAYCLFELKGYHPRERWKYVSSSIGGLLIDFIVFIAIPILIGIGCPVVGAVVVVPTQRTYWTQDFYLLISRQSY